MKRNIILWLLGAAFLVTGVALYSQQITGTAYRDPQKRFTMQVPRGWTSAAVDENTVQFAGGGAFATVFLFRASGSPQDVISRFAAQYQQQWQEFTSLKSQAVTFAGQTGAAAVFSGISPKGIASGLRIVAANAGERGYALIMSVPEDRFAALQPALDLIEKSFSIPGAPAQSQSLLGTWQGAERRGYAPEPESSRAAQPVTGIPRGGLPLRAMRSGACTALAPADWAIVAVDASYRGVDLSNGRFGAGWGVLGVEPGMAAYYPQYRSPETVLQWMTVGALRAGGDMSTPNFTAAQQFGSGYMMREYESERTHGAIVYAVFPTPTGGFVMVSRTAMGPKGEWQRYGTVAVSVALSIRCTTQLRASPDYPSGGRPSAREESTYNAQLGTEYAHDPSTGENFLMSHAGDYQENGPQGPGYYRRVGNEYRKLTPGRSD